jgi:hypothetical protein
VSGKDLKDDISRKVLGLFWNMYEDRFLLYIKINFAGKIKKRAKVSPDVDL